MVDIGAAGKVRSFHTTNPGGASFFAHTQKDVASCHTKGQNAAPMQIRVSPEHEKKLRKRAEKNKRTIPKELQIILEKFFSENPE